MTSTPASIGILPDELRAQQIACSYLIRGCEDALTRLSRAWIEADSEDEEAVRARAADILSEILEGWQETLEILRATAVPA
jgi:hypothetical protein